MIKTKYNVSASHPHPEYAFNNTEVMVAENHDGTFFANHPKLGCGKDYKTAEAAIRGLFQSHACNVTKIEEK